ncbi:S41 family peptidase [Streptococcus canis]|uniref:S41 family peptidase n=1 Tax=Streptococcus canis TaxID=1329 RepID=UPI002998FE3D|nr:S41 family peptidase [Streptococcus canis]
MKRYMKVLSLLGIPLMIILSIVIYGIQRYGPNFNLYLFPPSAQKYGDIALERLDMLGLYAQGEKWDKTCQEMHKALKKAKSYKEAQQILQKAVSVAGGKHSSLVSKNSFQKSLVDQQKPVAQVEDDILYLKVPAIEGLAPKTLTAYANKLNTPLTKNYKGAIVDLRGNTGGNMTPMLIGLSGLLPDGDLFSFEDKYRNKQVVELQGKELVNQDSIALDKPVVKQDIPVAVLIDHQTASSGEMTAFAFQGLENTLFFGEPTAGYTTGNNVIPLYDGALLVITSSRIINRQGQVYENNPIFPDRNSQDPLADAKQWLSEVTK